MKYAVVSIKGVQYKVSEESEILVPRFEAKTGEKLDVDKVLMVSEGDQVIIGNPYVEGALVHAKVEGFKKGDKLRVLKYKAKSRYRKTQGQRPEYVCLKITKITSRGSSK